MPLLDICLTAGDATIVLLPERGNVGVLLDIVSRKQKINVCVEIPRSAAGPIIGSAIIKPGRLQ